jgi:hypothetical protein
MKSQIIEQIGQADILLPLLVAEGLAANDRTKVRLSALQAARIPRTGFYRRARRTSIRRTPARYLNGRS